MEQSGICCHIILKPAYSLYRRTSSGYLGEPSTLQAAGISVVDLNEHRCLGLNIIFFFKKYKFTYFNWRLITLQYCIGFAIH